MTEYSRSDLMAEIRETYIHLNNRDVISRTMLTSSVLARWPETIIPQDIWTRRELVTVQCDKFLRSLKPETPEEAKQESLPEIEIHPGYKRLQKRYSIIRNGEPVSVTVQTMTRDELTAKAEEHQSQAAGHLEHSDELIRYRDNKFGEGDPNTNVPATVTV